MKKQANSDTAQGDLLAGTWSYLPGATRQKGGLLVEPRNFMIAEQDGAGGQPNPPINLYGSHLQASGDFVLSALMAAPMGTKASLQLYGAVPLIADEFRIEPKSVRFTVEDSTLTVQRWSGGDSQPSLTKTFTFASAPSDNLRVERTGSLLVVSMNGARLVLNRKYSKKEPFGLAFRAKEATGCSPACRRRQARAQKWRSSTAQHRKSKNRRREAACRRSPRSAGRASWLVRRRRSLRRFRRVV